MISAFYRSETRVFHGYSDFSKNEVVHLENRICELGNVNVSFVWLIVDDTGYQSVSRLSARIETTKVKGTTHSCLVISGRATAVQDGTPGGLISRRGYRFPLVKRWSSA